MDYIKQLVAFGLTEKEASVYTKALELGQFTISSIAHESGIKRPTCYLVIDELIKKGMVVRIPRGRKSLYSAESPEIIARNMQKNLDAAQKIIPHLQQIKSRKNNTPTIKFYTGRSGIEAIYEDILKSKPGSAIQSITPIDQILDVVGKDFFEKWVEQRRKKEIRAQTLYPSHNRPDAPLLSSNKELLRESRYLPKDFKIPGAIGLYEDKVAFFSTKKDNFGFIVKSEEFTTTFKRIFEFLWNEGTIDQQ